MSYEMETCNACGSICQFFLNCKSHFNCSTCLQDFQRYCLTRLCHFYPNNAVNSNHFFLVKIFYDLKKKGRSLNVHECEDWFCSFLRPTWFNDPSICLDSSKGKKVCINPIIKENWSSSHFNSSITSSTFIFRFFD